MCAPRMCGSPTYCGCPEGTRLREDGTCRPPDGCGENMIPARGGGGECVCVEGYRWVGGRCVPPTTRCPFGDCPTPRTDRCPDDTPKKNGECPSSNQRTCPDGSTVGAREFCPSSETSRKKKKSKPPRRPRPNSDNPGTYTAPVQMDIGIGIGIGGGGRGRPGGGRPPSGGGGRPGGSKG
jgi:hypothetical protein